MPYFYFLYILYIYRDVKKLNVLFYSDLLQYNEKCSTFLTVDVFTKYFYTFIWSTLLTTVFILKQNTVCLKCWCLHGYTDTVLYSTICTVQYSTVCTVYLSQTRKNVHFLDLMSRIYNYLYIYKNTTSWSSTFFSFVRR
jgi:hypothetical protein